MNSPLSNCPADTSTHPVHELIVFRIVCRSVPAPSGEGTVTPTGRDSPHAKVVETNRAASAHNLIRVVDESGEDYLYPVEWFAPITLPQTVAEKVLALAA